MGPEISTLGNQRSCVYMLLRSKDGVNISPHCLTVFVSNPEDIWTKKKELITHPNKNMQEYGYDTKYLIESALWRKVLKGSTVL